MSEKTNIEWATSTGNPWLGCTKVSPGCKNCYAATMDEQRFSKTMGGGTKDKPESHWGKGAPRVRTKAFWTDAVKWNREAENANRNHADQYDNEAMAYDGATFYPLPRPRIFPSLCDWLDDEVPIEWLADFLKLIHDTPNLDWLLLTKRPENFIGRICGAATHFKGEATMTRFLERWVLPVTKTVPANVWIGVSVEDQKRADERLPLLSKIPAHIRFASFEPLLEYIEPNIPVLKQATQDVDSGCGLDWAIIGGESGKGRRDCGVEAICDLADSLSFTNGIATFVKQDCAFKPGQQGRIPADVWALKDFPTPAATATR